MSASKVTTGLMNWAGLWFAALIWAGNMQLGQLLPYIDCRLSFHASAIASFGGAVLAMLSGFVSWSAARKIVNETSVRQDVVNFGVVVSMLSAAIFTFALLMQGVASLVLSGCER